MTTRQTIRSVLAALICTLGAASAPACGADSNCPTIIYFAAHVEVVGADVVVIEERVGSDDFVECQINMPDAGSSGASAECGAGYVGTLEIRATAADGRTASTTITTQERSNQCGPITQDVVLDLSN